MNSMMSNGSSTIFLGILASAIDSEHPCDGPRKSLLAVAERHQQQGQRAKLFPADVRVVPLNQGQTLEYINDTINTGKAMVVYLGIEQSGRLALYQRRHVGGSV